MERKRAQAAARASTKGRQSSILFNKALTGSNRGTTQNDVGYYPKPQQAGSRGDGVGRALVDMAGNQTVRTTTSLEHFIYFNFH